MMNRVLQEHEYYGIEEEEEDEEPIFVLTNEWRDFFAKSEAKRKLGSSFLPFLFFLSIIIVNLIVLLYYREEKG